VHLIDRSSIDAELLQDSRPEAARSSSITRSTVLSIAYGGLPDHLLDNAARRRPAGDEPASPISGLLSRSPNSKMSRGQCFWNLPWQSHDPEKVSVEPLRELPEENVPLDDPLLTTLPVTVIEPLSTSFFPP
jgi:hypothetical protein